MKTFKEVMDVIGVPAADLGSIFGLKPQTIRQMRLDPESDGYRPPPPGWEKALAEIARQKGENMADLAAELERAGSASGSPP